MDPKLGIGGSFAHSIVLFIWEVSWHGRLLYELLLFGGLIASCLPRSSLPALHFYTASYVAMKKCLLIWFAVCSNDELCSHTR